MMSRKTIGYLCLVVVLCGALFCVSASASERLTITSTEIMPTGGQRALAVSWITDGAWAGEIRLSRVSVSALIENAAEEGEYIAVFSASAEEPVPTGARFCVQPPVSGGTSSVGRAFGDSYRVFMVEDDTLVSIASLNATAQKLEFSPQSWGTYVVYYTAPTFTVSYYEDRIRPVSEAVLYREYSNLHRADTAPVPDAPEREGYRFTGWYIASGSGFISAEEERLGQVAYATSYFASWEPIEPFSTTAKKGDVDGDGNVMANDLVLLLSYFSTREGLTEQGAQNADMDNDGVLHVNDLIKLLNIFTLSD